MSACKPLTMGGRKQFGGKWTEATDPTTGNSYYYDTEKEDSTTWDKPEELMTPEEKALYKGVENENKERLREKEIQR